MSPSDDDVCPCRSDARVLDADLDGVAWSTDRFDGHVGEARSAVLASGLDVEGGAVAALLEGDGPDDDLFEVLRTVDVSIPAPFVRTGDEDPFGGWPIPQGHGCSCDGDECCSAGEPGRDVHFSVLFKKGGCMMAVDVFHPAPRGERAADVVVELQQLSGSYAARRHQVVRVGRERSGDMVHRGFRSARPESLAELLLSPVDGRLPEGVA